MGLGHPKQTLDEQLRANKREINRSIRELDRERTRLDHAEKKLIQDIRQAAEKGEMNATRIMAKDLVRTRRHQKKFYEMRSMLQGVNLRLQTVKSTQAMADSMKGVAKVMVRMNQQLDIPALRKVMANFMRESEKLGLTEDLMTDAVEDALGDEADEEEEDAVVSQVLDEIGVDISGKLLNAPPIKPLPAGQAAVSNVSAGPQKNPQPVAAGSLPATAAAPSAPPHQPSAGLAPTPDTKANNDEGGNGGMNISEYGKSLEERLKNLKA